MAERGAELEEQPLPDDDIPGDEPEPQDEPDPDELGDDPEPDPDAEPGDEPAPEPEPQRGRPSARDRVQQALRERDAANARAAAAETAQRERDAAQHARETATREAADRAEDERIMGGLDENGRVQYLMAKELKATKDGQSAILRRLDDANDRAAFAAKAAKDPRRAKLLDEVESAVARCPPGTLRDHVYFILLGKKLDEGALEPAQRQRQQAKRRVDAQQPPGRGAARSDARPRSGARAGNLISRMERDDPAI